MRPSRPLLVPVTMVTMKRYLSVCARCEDWKLVFFRILTLIVLADGDGADLL